MKTAAALLILGSLTRLASAEERVVTLDRTCVEIDETVDSLAAPDRAYATQLLQRVLEREDLLVVIDACSETYTLSHKLEGDHFVIRVRNSAGKRRMTTTGLDELSEKYGKMVRALIEAKAAAAVAPAPEPPPGLEPLPAPAPFAADDAIDNAANPAVDNEQPETFDGEEKGNATRMWYGMIGALVSGGKATSIGYRRELADGKNTLDFALALREGDTMDSDSGDGMSLGIELLRKRYLNGKSSAYAGGGISLGFAERYASSYNTGYGGSYRGDGLQGELTGGLHFGGRRGIQALVQVDITLPFYQMSNGNGESRYQPAMAFSAGIGW